MILNGHTPEILLTRACPPTIVLIEFAKLEVKLSLSLHFHMHLFCAILASTLNTTPCYNTRQTPMTVVAICRYHERLD